MEEEKSGSFLFVMSLWLLVAPEIVLTADSWDPSLIFDPSFAENQPCVTPKTQ
jgi:hypothetical protein